MQLLAVAVVRMLIGSIHFDFVTFVVVTLRVDKVFVFELVIAVVANVYNVPFALSLLL